MFAHGDLLIIRRPEVAVDQMTVAEPENGRVILARGEATGHHHSIDARLGRLYWYRPDDMPSGLSVGRLVVDAEGARLEHQEHGAIDLPPGQYEVRRQREHDPIEELRLVAD